MVAWLLDAGMLEFAMDAGSLLDLVGLSFMIFFCSALFYVSSFVSSSVAMLFFPVVLLAQNFLLD